MRGHKDVVLAESQSLAQAIEKVQGSTEKEGQRYQRRTNLEKRHWHIGSGSRMSIVWCGPRS